MSNIYPSILEKLAALNIDIYHYEDLVRYYVHYHKSFFHTRAVPRQHRTVAYATVLFVGDYLLYLPP